MQTLSLAFQCGRVVIREIAKITGENLDKLSQNSIDYLAQLFLEIKTSSSNRLLFLKKCSKIQVWRVVWRKKRDTEPLLGLLSRQTQLLELTVANEIDRFSNFILGKPFENLQKLVLIKEQKINGNILNTLPNLRELKIAYPTEEITDILKSATYHTNLEDLQVCFTKVDPSVLSTLLKTNTTLKRIAFSYSKCSSDVIDALSEGFQENKSVRVLEFSEIYFAGSCKNLFRHLQHHEGLEAVRVSYARFRESNEMADIAKQLGLNNNLQEITCICRGTDEGGCPEALELDSLSTLKKLHLSGYTISKKSLKAYFTDLASNKTLIHLDLSRTISEGRKQFLQLSRAIKENQTLEVLNLSGNNLGELGAQYLAKELKNCNIKELNLADNNLTTAGCLTILKCLKDNQSLEKLSFADNNLASDTIGDVIDLIRTMGKLMVLDLSWNNLDLNAHTILREFSRERPISFAIDLSE